MRGFVIALCVTAVAGSACSDQSVTGPTNSVRVFTWTGTITDGVNGTGQVTITASGASGALLGTWTVRFPGREAGGQVVADLAKIGSPEPTFLMNPAVPLSCPNAPIATFGGWFFLEVSGSEAAMTGKSRYSTCDSLVEGRVELTRQ